MNSFFRKNYFHIPNLLFLFFSISIAGCNVYQSQGRKDFEDARDFQIVVAAYDKNQNIIELELNCQNFIKAEIKNDNENSICGITEPNNQNIYFHKQLSSNQFQICKPRNSNTNWTFDQLSFFENSYCELEK